MPDSATPDPASPSPTPKLKPGKQSRIIQAYIGDSEIFLHTAATDSLIRPLLEARGYDMEAFAEGLALTAAAHATFEDRAEAMGQQHAGTAALRQSNQEARHEYARFRAIARASFPDRADRLALSLTGDVPEDTGRFITLATASYTAGKTLPQAAKLAKRGYPAAVLDTHLAALRSLATTASGQDEGMGDAIEDTSHRDAAYDALRAWMKELKGVAKGALRHRPDLLAKLGL